MKNLYISLLLITSISLSAQQYEKKLYDFNRVSVSNSIAVNIYFSNENKIKVKTKEAISSLSAEIENGELQIKFNEINKGENVLIDLFVKELHAISASSNAEVAMVRPLTSDTLELLARSGGSIKVDVQNKYLKVLATEGCFIELAGQTNYISATSKTKGAIEAFKLEAQKADLNASLGGIVKVKVTDQVKAEAGAGSYIGIKGQPAKVDKKTKLNGIIDLLDM